MVHMVFIGRIDMRLGPPKSVFGDPGVVLGASSIEMQKTTSTGAGFWYACYVNDLFLPNWASVAFSPGNKFVYKSGGPEVAPGGPDVRVIVGKSTFHFSRFRFDVFFGSQIWVIHVVFIGRINMRLGPPKSVFWDPGVVLGAFSIEVQ